MHINTLSRGLGKTKPHLFKVPPTAWAGSPDWTWACEGIHPTRHRYETGYGVSREHAYAVWDNFREAAKKIWKRA